MVEHHALHLLRPMAITEWARRRRWWNTSAALYHGGAILRWPWMLRYQPGFPDQQLASAEISASTGTDRFAATQSSRETSACLSTANSASINATASRAISGAVFSASTNFLLACDQQPARVMAFAGFTTLERSHRTRRPAKLVSLSEIPSDLRLCLQCSFQFIASGLVFVAYIHPHARRLRLPRAQHRQDGSSSKPPCDFLTRSAIRW